MSDTSKKEEPSLSRKLSVLSEAALSNLDQISLTLDNYTKEMLRIDEQFTLVNNGKVLDNDKETFITLL